MKKLLNHFYIHVGLLLVIGAHLHAYEEYAQLPHAYRNNETKEWTFLIYMAADNDLLPFADRNIEQLKQIGSNANLNVLVHMHTHRPRSNKVTKKLVIYKDRVAQVGPDECKDSGNEQTLIDACTWALTDFKAKNFVLVFWNHGSGDINPLRGHSINPTQLFNYNKQKNLLELDRSTGLLDLLESEITLPTCHRGVCFDETTGNYLNDQKLQIAFEKICNGPLHGKKIDYILWDTCMMGGVGTAHNCSKYADRIVVSEEVVLGTGYNYTKLLKPLALNQMPLDQLAHHVVRTYEETYSRITNDYTQSAFELKHYEELQQSVDLTARILIEALEKQKDKSVTQALKASRDRNQCTHFWEPSYIDFAHLCNNILKNIPTMQFHNFHEGEAIKTALQNSLYQGLAALNKMVIINAAGKNYKKAGGLSIYFPEYAMHPSYPATEFAKHNNWGNFLKTYLHK